MYKIKKIKDVLPRPKNQNLQKLTPFPPKKSPSPKNPPCLPPKNPPNQNKKAPELPFLSQKKRPL